MIRVLIVTNFLSPYRVPLLAAIAAEKDFELKVVFLAESEAGRDWKSQRSSAPFETQVLPGIHWSIPAREFHIHWNWGLSRAIDRFRPDVVITSGYEHFTFLRAMLYTKIRRKPFLFWFESSLLSAERSRGVIAAIKKFLIQNADGHVAFGTKARECLEAYGAPPERVFLGLNTVDMDWHRAEWEAARSRAAFASERSKYPPIVFLYVGRFIPLKNLHRMLEAYGRLRDPDVGMVLVGSGPEQAGLEALCRQQQIRNVFFEGFHQPSELPRFYAMADVLLLPSTKEVWGLVVNEALASGLYVLVSDRAGAGYDLIRDGWNGRLFDPYSVEQMADRMRDAKERIAEIRERREAIADHACREFGIGRSAAAFVDAIRAVGNS